MQRWAAPSALAAVAFGLVLASVPAQGQGWHQCGDLTIVFRNPDLQPGADGFIRASGKFFAQFQAIGAQADDIATFGFSFGPQTQDFDDNVCSAPVWFTGPYVLNYRADRDASDGFFIPLKTTLVPDGTYAVAVHTYDAQDNELARFWSKAIVDNCDGDARCDGDLAQNAKHDRVGPWPIVLPGDGEAPDGRTGFTVEFGEPVTGVKAYLNGQEITSELAEWEGRVWDADFAPDYGPHGIGRLVAPPCTLQAPVHVCEKYGPSYQWTKRMLTKDDFLRVEATDAAGNLARKDIHLGSSTVGGAVTADTAIVQMTVKEIKRDVQAGQPAEFPVQFTNTGGGEGHVNLLAEGPAGWNARWVPPHVVVPVGGTRDATVVVEPPAGTPPGSRFVNITAEYQAGAETKKFPHRLEVNVQGGGPGGALAAGGTTSTTPAGEDTPMTGVAFVVAAVAATAALRRTRRAP